MMTTLLSLLGGGLGGLLRFVPEIFKLYSENKDRDHEHRMTELQYKIDEARAKQQIDLVHAQGEVAVQAGEMQAFVEAIKGQSAPTGVAWVDALNASVRPVITYWWMTLFTVYKIAALTAAARTSQSIQEFIGHIWSAQDAGILAMILGFWFVDRSIRKNTGC